jgi:hypothetical protein
MSRWSRRRDSQRQVREAESSDLDGSRWPRGKAHDDATVAYCCAIGRSLPNLAW